VVRIREGAPIFHQERQEHREDEIRHLYLSAFPVRAPEGHVNEILVMLQDITDLETLRKSEARYQLLFDRSADAIIMAHPETFEIVMANREARRLLGLGPEGTVSRNLLQLHPEEIRPVMRNHYRRLESGRTLENLEVEVLAEGEEVRTCNACGTRFDLDGQNLILVEFRDVTRLRELQAELARSDHLITLGTMNAGIAHEFKNRLAPLRAFAQLITLDRMPLDRVMNHAPLIIEEIDRLTGLVRDILDYARPQEPRREPQDLTTLAGTLCQETAWEFARDLDEHGVTLAIELDPEDGCPVLVDPVQLRRIFTNLFKNSLEALAERAGGPRKLTVAVIRRGRGIVLSVEDTGCGIREDHLTRIFDPFFTTKGSRGTGLGMCITRSLIEANGGEITVESCPGRGTRSEVSFPAAVRGSRRNRDAA
jgi:PAS domain S-box-containing protein